MSQLTTDLKKHKDSWPFLEPVSGVADYYNVIKDPMDLRTLGTKVDEGAYETLDEYAKVIVTFCDIDVGARIHTWMVFYAGRHEDIHKLQALQRGALAVRQSGKWAREVLLVEAETAETGLDTDGTDCIGRWSCYLGRVITYMLQFWICIYV
jgi:hypothetical protein